MTPILFYDTETSGLPQWSLPSEDPSQPHITQIAAELHDEDTGTTLAFMDLLIKPDGWTIPEELEALTGITNEKAVQFGVPIEKALALFLGLWRKADLRVAHNESFDMRMVRIEMMRQLDHDAPIHEDWKTAPAFCTQSKSTKIINLPPTEKMLAAGRRTPKSPNLGEAFRHFTGTELVGAHNAAVDLAACRTVYYGIKRHLSTAA
ncbi:3'-5' exonuclease [Cupriavidus basilensis]|uniref:DNA polymerase III alpha subunit n=1 Tax=Cupriavidus basilensis TaxID=68895 RepID=A0A0C4Y7N0_9BURK|nr:3'-5' exonuclease [Cupriavidus basilensis]AJG19025.1 DNA polymerase III alpha subunit [Cupriavidus basilensis]